jgi:hypothetical protein
LVAGGFLAAGERFAAEPLPRLAAGLAEAAVLAGARFADAAVLRVDVLAAPELRPAVELRPVAGFAADAELRPAAGFVADAGLRPAAGLPADAGLPATPGRDGGAAVVLDEDLDPRTADGRFAVAEAADEGAAPVAGAAPRRAKGLRAVAPVPGRRGAGEPPGLTSSAAMRLVSPSTSLRRPLSSARTRSSSTSRMRLAALVTSFARPRVDLAPSADAVKVRSTAWRTASTASAAPAVALSFLLLFFESFFGIAERS